MRRATIVAVQRCFNWAVGTAGLIAVNPFARVPKPRGRRRKIAIDRRQRVRLRRRARPDFRALLLGIEETAARPQEVRAVSWDCLGVEDERGDFWGQVRDGRGYWVLEENKASDRRGDGGPSRVLPVSPRLGRLLFRLAHRSRAEGTIFKTAAGRAWTSNALRLRM